MEQEKAQVFDVVDDLSSIEVSHRGRERVSPNEHVRDPCGIPFFIEIPILSSTREQAMALGSPKDVTCKHGAGAPLVRHNTSSNQNSRRALANIQARDRAPKSIQRSLTPPVFPSHKTGEHTAQALPHRDGVKVIFFLSVDVEPRILGRQTRNSSKL